MILASTAQRPRNGRAARQARLIQRKRSRTNTRAYVVSLTAAGWTALKMAKPKIAKADRKALSALNEDLRLALLAALDTIAGI